MHAFFSTPESVITVMSDTILIVDDKASVRQLLQEYLAEQGYRVITADNGENALYTSRHDPPDLILLDIMMPKMDGFEFLRRLRQNRQTPVIVLSARQDEPDAVLALELGADDYVVKPFRMRELHARIRAVLRRAENTPVLPKRLQVGEVELDPSTHRVSVAGQPVVLTPIEFDLLYTLMRAPEQVFRRAQLVDALAESGFTGLESTLNVHVHNLRAKLRAAPAQHDYIESVFGVGYRMCKEAVEA